MVVANITDINNVRIANVLGFPPTAQAPRYATDDMTALYLIKVLHTRFKYKLVLQQNGYGWVLDISHPDDINLSVLGYSNPSASKAITDSVIRMFSLCERVGKLPKE